MPHAHAVPTAVLTLILLSGCSDAAQAPAAVSDPAVVAHVRACVETAPALPCPPLDGVGPAYWIAAWQAQSPEYLDAAEICLRAALGSAKAGREGACVDVYEAYAGDAGTGRADLGGRLSVAEVRRGLATARIVLQRRRSQEFIEGMRSAPRQPVPQTIN